MTNHSHFVHVNGNNYSCSPVTSGVPQGSVLGPLLFLIYINEIPQFVFSSISLFADDCVVYWEITRNLDVSILQSDIINSIIGVTRGLCNLTYVSQ